MKQCEILNNTVWCRLAPSDVGGLGVFAIRDIPKGTLITEHRLRDAMNGFESFTMSVDDFNKLIPEIRELILERMLFEEGDELRFVSPNHEQQLESFLNHSDIANCKNGITLRDIKKGEELFINYNEMMTKPHTLTINKMKGII